jgi:hypothetical protein
VIGGGTVAPESVGSVLLPPPQADNNRVIAITHDRRIM